MEYLTLQEINPDKLIKISKWEDDPEDDNKQVLYRTYGLQSDDTHYHKHVRLNTFTREEYEIPQGWKVKKVNNYVFPRMYNTTKQIFVPKEILQGYDKKYKTVDNGGIGFVVLIKDNHVYIYGMTNDIVPYDFDGNFEELFDNLVKIYEPKHIFVGKSVLNKMTEFSGGHGDKWDGNSLLLDLGDNLYVHIGMIVFEFKTDEPITKYVSSVGNSAVPYPYAESENWCYSMSDIVKTPVTDHPNREYNGHIDYFDNAKYESISETMIAKRSDYFGEMKPEKSTKSYCCRFKKPTQVQFAPNSC